MREAAAGKLQRGKTARRHIPGAIVELRFQQEINSPLKARESLGIYEIDGDMLKYCLAPAGKPRPQDFTSKEGSGDSLGVMKREKP